MTVTIQKIKQWIQLGAWTQAERAIRPFLKNAAEDSEIQSLHRKIRSELSRICEVLVTGFEYLGTYFYACGSQHYRVAEYEHLLTGMDFVLLPPHGTAFPFEFQIGSFQEESDSFPSKIPLRAVTLSRPYLISKTLVPQKVWKKVMNENPSYFQYGENHPVETIRWCDCLQFCQKVFLSLPSEAHWEYACRSGTQTAFCFGSHLHRTLANYYSESEQDGLKSLNHTTPVAMFPPNAFGLYDMHGNVWEYCVEWSEKDSESHLLTSLQNPPDSKQVFRGGSFSDGERYCRSSFYLKNTPDYYGPDIGFRLMKLL